MGMLFPGYHKVDWVADSCDQPRHLVTHSLKYGNAMTSCNDIIQYRQALPLGAAPDIATEYSFSPSLFHVIILHVYACSVNMACSQR